MQRGMRFDCRNLANDPAHANTVEELKRLLRVSPVEKAQRASVLK